MSFSIMSPIKDEWIVIILDPPEAFQKCFQVSPHGTLLFAGAFFDSDDVLTSEQAQIKGIVLLIGAESKEEVLEQLKKDIYMESGIENQKKM
ncbi:hypothetical protein BCON_0013g00440 [Botryotinia convoluta]|uniref:Uncharacterized protein n=1 Tax=Botryotinia convoluta TaxID=54673 RepID=A0A4Z1IPM5_9HELO|nr:hypothetical protein BCON_0013g00440 [Botryotinia convoluta]